jgi:hypothetical protein
MPVNSTHPEYDAALPAWLRARDVLAGEDAVKAAGERYLPRLDSQSDDEFDAYKDRALFFNATARTADGFVGLISRRDATVKCGTRSAERGTGNGAQGSPSRSSLDLALAGFLDDADMQGTALASYAKNIVGEVVAVGRAGTLIDWEDASRWQRHGQSGAPGERRAYAVLYRAEQILNWRTERINGRNVLTLLALLERVESTSPKDEFEPEMVEQIRVLRLVDGGDGAQGPGAQRTARPTSAWRYEVEVWQPQREWTWRGSKTRWELVESHVPLRLGRPLPRIPFVFHGPRHSLPAVEKLPLTDIIAANLDHYRLDADYKHGLHFTALPTAYVSGFDKGAELRIGSSTAWHTETPGATAGFLEFTGQGLTTFERAMEHDERNMAVLGSRLLEAQKRVGETVDAIELRQSGENSVLTTLALSVSDSLTHVLRWIYWWSSTEELPEDIGEDRVLVQLNTDFSSKGMASDEISAVVAAWQAGAISQKTMFDLFRRGEVLPAGRTDEEEAQLAKASQGADGGLRMAGGKQGPAKAGTTSGE